MNPEAARRRPPVRVQIAGSRVDAIDMEGCVELVRQAVTEGERLRILVTNANKAWLARRDPRLRWVLESAELVIAEWATAWAAGVLRVPGIHHVGGLTLMQRLLREANERRWSVYLLGGEPHVVEALVWRLANSHPGLRIVGSHHGYFREEERGLVVAAAAGCQPDLLFVALGSPLQEYVIAELPEPGPRVSLGVGGSFDVLAGFKRDAPGWARGRGLEWLFRVAQDPARYWKRYAVTNSWFVATVLREWLHSRTAS